VRRLINEFPKQELEQAWCGELSEAIANNGVPLNEVYYVAIVSIERCGVVYCELCGQWP